MKLIGNVVYRVTIRMPSGAYMNSHLTYCGGSVVDNEGHHISGGVWAYPKGNGPDYTYFHDLDVRNIKEVLQN